MLAPALASCGGDDDNPLDRTTAPTGEQPGDGQTAPETNEATEAGAGSGEAAGVAAGTITGKWEGTYECGGATSAVRINVVDVAGGPVEAFFEFGDDLSAEPVGSFRLRGTRDEAGITLDPLDWVKQPTGYSMVGLEVSLPAASPDRLSGTVIGEGCSTFEVDLVDPDPWYVGVWKGGYICAQGRTDITLDLKQTEAAGVEAVFTFFANEDNPEVPSGSYTLAGTWADGAVNLEPVEWVEQPAGYHMVGVESYDIAIGPDLMAGRIDDPSCDQFIMERSPI